MPQRHYDTPEGRGYLIAAKGTHFTIKTILVAQIDPRGIEHTTECYAVIREEHSGFIAGRLLNWRLHDLRYPLVERPVSKDPAVVEAAFDTREELEEYLAERLIMTG